MTKVLLNGLLVATSLLTVPAFAEQSKTSNPIPPASQVTPGGTRALFTSGATTLGELLDKPETKAVLQKHVPTLIANPNIEMGRGMTLRALQAYAGDILTEEKIAAIDAELAKIAN